MVGFGENPPKTLITELLMVRGQTARLNLPSIDILWGLVGGPTADDYTDDIGNYKTMVA